MEPGHCFMTQTLLMLFFYVPLEGISCPNISLFWHFLNEIGKTKSDFSSQLTALFNVECDQIAFFKLASRQGCIFYLLSSFNNTCSYILLLWLCFVFWIYFCSSPSSFIRKLLFRLFDLGRFDASRKRSRRYGSSIAMPPKRSEKKIEISAVGLEPRTPPVQSLAVVTL